MAEPFEILGLVGVVLQIFETGVKLGLSWKEAPQEIRGFMTELESLKTVLSETNTNLVLNKDFKDAFEGRRSAVLSHLGEPLSGPSTMSLLHVCREELDKLLDRLKKSSEGHRMGWSRLKAAFLVDQTHAAVQDLQRRCQTLNGLISIDCAALAATTLAEVRETKEELRDQQLTEKDARILEWLTPLNFGPQLNDNLDRREAGTGQWLLESKEFQDWMQSDGRVLFCPGMPGAGKTIITSIVIEHLHRQFQGDVNVGVAFIFFNFRRHDEQTISGLLASLLKQLCQGRVPLPAEVRKLFDDNRQTRPSNIDLSKTLQLVIESYFKVYILVDALDECETEDGRRDKLLTTILHLPEVSNTSVFATSRFIPEITSYFENHVMLEIEATESDVKKYLEGHILELPAFVKRNAQLQEEIKTEIVQAVRGMFLLARLHLQSLTGKRSPKAIKSALGKLSTGSEAYDKAYDEAMERIEGQVEDQAALAKDALSWVVCSRRPLTTLELQHALAVETWTSELDEDNIPDIEDIVSACAGLLTINEESGTIGLVHYTTQEYFERTKCRWLPDAEALLAVSCVTYLSFDVFSAGPIILVFEEREHEEPLKVYEARLQSNPLYQYAATNWGYHAREVSVVSEEIRKFLRNGGPNLAASYEVICESRTSYGPSGGYDGAPRKPQQLSGLHVAAHFGYRVAISTLLDEESACEQDGQACVDAIDVNVTDSCGLTPLMYAVFLRDAPTVELLVSYKETDPNVPNPPTPLKVAAYRGEERIVRSLFGSGRITHTLSDALFEAASEGHESIVRFLLDTGKVDPDCRVRSNDSPLNEAARHGHASVVRILLDTGKVDPSSKGMFSRTPLANCASCQMNDYMDVYRMLVETGKADINAQGRERRTALWETVRRYVTWGPDLTAIRYLIEVGNADVNIAEFDDITVLTYAASYNRHELVEYLLDSGKADPSLYMKTHRGTTPLQAAIESHGPDCASARLIAARIKLIEERNTEERNNEVVS